MFQGRPHKVRWLLRAMYEWLATERYSIDWKGVRASLRSGGGRECLARSIRQLVRQKARQLLQDYCFQSLLQGKSAVGVQLRGRWFTELEVEYGLSMRDANRKYNVPKAVTAERLEIGWCKGARVRAMCFEMFGYEPEMEKCDQSFFHANDSGFASVPTLALAGPRCRSSRDTPPRATDGLRTSPRAATKNDVDGRPAIRRVLLQGIRRRTDTPVAGAHPQLRIWPVGVRRHVGQRELQNARRPQLLGDALVRHVRFLALENNLGR